MRFVGILHRDRDVTALQMWDMLTPHETCDIDPTALTSCPKISSVKSHLNIFEPKRLTARRAHTSSPQWVCDVRQAGGWQRVAARQARSMLTELEKTWRVHTEVAKWKEHMLHAKIPHLIDWKFPMPASQDTDFDAFHRNSS